MRKKRGYIVGFGAPPCKPQSSSIILDTVASEVIFIGRSGLFYVLAEGMYLLKGVGF